LHGLYYTRYYHQGATSYPPPRIRSSEHRLTLVSLKPAHLRSHPKFPLRSIYLLRGYASGFVSRNWEIALAETVSKRSRHRLVCHSAVDKVLIYALSPASISLFFLFHTHRIYLSSSSSCFLSSSSLFRFFPLLHSLLNLHTFTAGQVSKFSQQR
jgi:hypothetical protein